LVGNALRYTRNGGISIASVPKNGEVDVVVKDTGIGIVEERLAHIFEIGTKGAGSPGMGFGLAIAKYLVELQGGYIDVKSTVGKGTEVTVTLSKAGP
jgi:signal transduction histidine kinase